MDPSIMKFLEEDEDETMHSGADVEAFTAALNRDIEGDNTSTSQTPTTTDAGGALSQGTNHTPSQLFQQWQSANREGNTSYSNEEEVKPQIHEQQSSAMEANRHGSGSGSETQHPPNDTSREMNLSQSEPSRPQDDQHNVHMSQTMNAQNSEKNPVNSQEPNIARNPENESQLQRMNRMGNQQQQQAMSATGQAANAMNRPSGKQVPFSLLFPVIEPQLDKDRAMQLQGLYVRLRNNNINKEEFIRHMRSLVGDHMVKTAVYKLQQGQGQLSGKHNIQKPSPYVPPSAEASSLPMDNNAQKSRLLEHQSDASKQDREQQPFPPLQGPFKQQQQQHMQFPQPPFPNYGNPSGNFHPGSNPNMNMTSQSFKPQSHDLQMRQGPVVHHQVGGIGSQGMNPMSQNVFNDMKRMHGGNLSHLAHSQSSMHKDHMLMSGKQFKILNRKLNSLLQLQADARGRNMFSGIEVDVMLKAQEHRLQNKLDQMNKCNKLRVKAQSDSFNGELKELKAVAKERHALFVQDVKTVRENVNFKIEELRNDMAKEVVELNHNYYSLRTKVDIIVDAVTKVIECYTSLAPKIEKKVEVDVQAFEKMDKLLTDLKDLVSKSSSSSLLTPEFLTQKFRLLESSIHNELAPIAKLANLIPTDAPLVSTEVQGGERKSVGMSSRTVKREGASGKTEGDAKVVGIVKSNQIPSSMPKSSDPIISTTTTTTTTTKPIVKGIVIRRSSSSWKQQPPKATDKSKGKGISVEPTKEKRKVAIEEEIIKRRAFSPTVLGGALPP